MRARIGMTLIEVVMSIGLIVMLFGGIYLAYYSILDVITNSELRSQAAAILNQKVETARNLPYDQVGTVGGSPSGILPQTEIVTSSKNIAFQVYTTVRNVDDPFDGMLGGTPNDTAPADYKVVEFTTSCLGCARFTPLAVTTTVAPKSLEGATNNGLLFINVIDANGQPVQTASVHVTNASVTPAIDLTDITNINGVLQLVDIPTSTLRYQIQVSKSGYSSDRNYIPGDPTNPNPVNSAATVAEQTLTQTTFIIDRVSAMRVHTTDFVCAPIQNQSVSLKNLKLIGTNPDLYKFSATGTTATSGLAAFSNLEYGNYAMTATTTYDLAGTIPFTPFFLNPSSTTDFYFVLNQAQPNSLMATIKSATSGPIYDVTVNLTRSGYSSTSTTGHAVFTHTDWSGGAYDSLDGITPAGSLTLSGPPYSTSTTGWLISKTIDVGSSTASYFTLSWAPVSQPLGTSVQFQIASNNDQATWNFAGPDGTSNSYYTISGDPLSAAFSNNRYLRYKVFLSTNDEAVTPQVSSVNIEFTSICVPPGQVLFQSLGVGSYTLTVSAPGYTTATSSVTVGSGWQSVNIPLSP